MTTYIPFLNLLLFMNLFCFSKPLRCIVTKVLLKAYVYAFRTIKSLRVSQDGALPFSQLRGTVYLNSYNTWLNGRAFNVSIKFQFFVYKNNCFYIKKNIIRINVLANFEKQISTIFSIFLHNSNQSETILRFFLHLQTLMIRLRWPSTLTCVAISVSANLLSIKYCILLFFISFDLQVNLVFSVFLRGITCEL